MGAEFSQPRFPIHFDFERPPEVVYVACGSEEIVKYLDSPFTVYFN